MIADVIRKCSEALLNVFPRTEFTELGHHECSKKTPHDGCTLAALPYAFQGVDSPAFITVCEFEASLGIDHVNQLYDCRRNTNLMHALK